MNGKIAGLLFFAFVLIFPVCAEPFSEESAPLTDEYESLSEEPLPEEEAEESIYAEADYAEADYAETEPLPDEETEHLFYAEADLVFYAETGHVRSFNDIFPNLSPLQRARSFSSLGIRYSFEKHEIPQLIPSADSGVDLLSLVMEKKPSHIIEALVVVPYRGRELDRVDAYNALSRINNIKNQSIPLRGRDIYFFTETTRLESAKKMKPIPDPSSVYVLPSSETMYLRFEDAFFGTLYIRGDISATPYGIIYNMTNFKTVRYYLLPVMKTETFSAIIYLEPLEDGMLIYSMSGIYIPGFAADKVNLTPNMNARIMIFINWITEGLRREENGNEH